MRTKKEDAPAKVRNFYKKAKALILMSGGEIKPGMFQMVTQMTGGITNANAEDLDLVNNMTEEEWMEYALPKFFPGYFGPRNTEPAPAPNAIDYTAKLDSILENSINLGKVMVNVCGKLDQLISLQTQMLECWKGGQ